MNILDPNLDPDPGVDLIYEPYPYTTRLCGKKISPGVDPFGARDFFVQQ